MNPVQTILSYLFEIYFNITLLSITRFSQVVIFFRFRHHGHVGTYS
jgi:hypothetical protein